MITALHRYYRHRATGLIHANDCPCIARVPAGRLMPVLEVEVEDQSCRVCLDVDGSRSRFGPRSVGHTPLKHHRGERT